MKYLSILLLILVTGCSTVVPVAPKFPDAPKYSMEKCPSLQQIDDSAKLSGVAIAVTSNYKTYHECAVKNDAWIDWYQTQKRIYESVK